MQHRLLILAPRGRDAAIASDLLNRAGIPIHVCPDLPALVEALIAGAGAVMITEEALAAADRGTLTAWVASQPSWSDLPFVVLANGNRAPRSAAATQRLEELGNVVLLERPLHADAMVGAVRSALKARERQYEVRAAAEGLERAVADRTRELGAARDSLEIALEAADMGGWDIDLLTGESRRTLRHDQILGYAEVQPQWSTDRLLQHVEADQRPRMTAAFEQAIRAGGLDVECRITRADGVGRWIVVRGRVRHDADGKPVRMTGVIWDVTAQKEADAQLAQAQKMDAIGQLTGGVAHDFNNLLTPIVGSLDLVRRRHKDDERTQRMVAGALQAAERAATLTQRLLAFARRQALQPQAIDVTGLIDNIVDLIRRTLGPGVTVVLDIPDHLPAALIDPNQLELALLNLAINARDAMPDGGRLTITADQVEADERGGTDLRPGRYVRVIAIDTGVGMDEATLARATEPFFSTKGVGKGTGLGLSMVHGLAAQSGGTLRMTSTPGEGTQVALWLPVTDEAVQDKDVASAEPTEARRAAIVLLVDDEEVVRFATADMLRDIGYTVVDVGSAHEALEALRGGLLADVLVTDYLMPGMTGAALINELRGAGRGIPALLVTGYVTTGADMPSNVPLLAKPFRQVDLAGKVDEILHRAGDHAGTLRAAE